MNKERTTFCIVRHGESEANKRKIISGIADHKLTLEGKIQALTFGTKLANEGIVFDAVYSSDLRRAVDTAALVTNAQKKKNFIITVPSLRERHYGEMEGKNVSELYVKLAELEELPHEQRVKQRFALGAESDEEVAWRFTKSLSGIAVNNQGKTVLIATHGGAMCAFLTHTGTLGYKELRRVGNMGLILAESDGKSFQIKKMEGVETR